MFNLPESSADQTSTPASAARSGLSLWKKIGLATAGVALGAILVVRFAVLPGMVDKQVRAEAAKVLNAPLDFDGVGLSLWRGAVTLENVRLGAVPNSALGKENLFVAQSVTVGFSFLDLLGGAPQPTVLEIQDGEALFVGTAFTNNWSDAFKEQVSTDTSKTNPNAAKPLAEWVIKRAVYLDRFELDDFKLTIRPDSTQKFVLAGLDLNVGAKANVGLDDLWGQVEMHLDSVQIQSQYNQVPVQFALGGLDLGFETEITGDLDKQEWDLSKFKVSYMGLEYSLSGEFKTRLENLNKDPAAAPQVLWTPGAGFDAEFKYKSNADLKQLGSVLRNALVQFKAMPQVQKVFAQFDPQALVLEGKCQDEGQITFKDYKPGAAGLDFSFAGRCKNIAAGLKPAQLSDLSSEYKWTPNKAEFELTGKLGAEAADVQSALDLRAQLDLELKPEWLSKAKPELTDLGKANFDIALENGTLKSAGNGFEGVTLSLKGTDTKAEGLFAFKLGGAPFEMKWTGSPRAPQTPQPNMAQAMQLMAASKTALDLGQKLSKALVQAWGLSEFRNPFVKTPAQDAAILMVEAQRYADLQKAYHKSKGQLGMGLEIGYTEPGEDQSAFTWDAFQPGQLIATSTRDLGECPAGSSWTLQITPDPQTTSLLRVRTVDNSLCQDLVPQWTLAAELF